MLSVEGEGFLSRLAYGQPGWHFGNRCNTKINTKIVRFLIRIQIVFEFYFSYLCETDQIVYIVSRTRRN